MIDEDFPRNGAGSQRGLRRANERRLVETLRREGSSSQAQLARRSGLSRATVNNIVHELVAEGVLRITSGTSARTSVVSLVATAGSLIAIEIGQQQMRGSIVSFARETRVDETVDLVRAPGARSDVDTVTALVSSLLEGSGTDASELEHICVGLHAPYDSQAKRVSPSSFLPLLEGVDVGEVLEEQFGVPVVVDNDANFAALAEWTWGAGRGSEHFYYVEFSHSIGSGIVLNGEVYRGSNGTAGEIGHVVVDERGVLCNCGSRGCLAAVASGRAILLQLRAAGNPKPSLAAVIDSAQSGDASCVRALTEAGQYLGRALSHVVRIMAPSAVVLGGSLAAAGPLVVDGVRAALDPKRLRGGAPTVRVAVGLPRNDMCVLGSVAHVLALDGRGISELPEWLREPVARRTAERTTI